MTDPMANLKRIARDAPQGMGVPACKSCDHRLKRASLDECLLHGYLTGTSRGSKQLCGLDGKHWTPKPPSFLKRLQNAIIDRISGASHD